MSDHLGLLVVPLVDGDGVYLAAPEPEVSLPAAEPVAPAFLAVGEAAYAAALQALLPAGWAWPRAPEANLTRCVQAIGVGSRPPASRRSPGCWSSRPTRARSRTCSRNGSERSACRIRASPMPR